MSTFVFRNVKYDYAILEKVMGEGHLQAVDVNLICTDTLGLSKAHTVLGNKPPVAFKVDGKYVLLMGALETKHNKPTLNVITKFTLKKCKIELPVQVVAKPAYRSHQDEWNEKNKQNSRQYDRDQYLY